jgi:hypothetical protein
VLRAEGRATLWLKGRRFVIEKGRENFFKEGVREKQKKNLFLSVSNGAGTDPSLWFKARYFQLGNPPFWVNSHTALFPALDKWEGYGRTDRFVSFGSRDELFPFPSPTT